MALLKVSFSKVIVLYNHETIYSNLILSFFGTLNLALLRFERVLRCVNFELRQHIKTSLSVVSGKGSVLYINELIGLVLVLEFVYASEHYLLSPSSVWTDSVSLRDRICLP